MTCCRVDTRPRTQVGGRTHVFEVEPEPPVEMTYKGVITTKFDKAGVFGGANMKGETEHFFLIWESNT